MPDSRLHRLSALGQSVWIDFLSRDLVHGVTRSPAGQSPAGRETQGGLARMMEEDAVTGVTSNPTIFQKAISEGSAYDEQLRDLVEHEDDAKEIFIALAGRDVGDACDLMRSVWDGGEGLRGYVSMEVDPTLAYDSDGTLAEAKRLHGLLDKPNLYVKIPGTAEGLGPIEEMIAAGKSINVTLIFSVQRHREVMEAYIRGIERLVEGGGDPRPVSSVASYFVSRVDTEADKRLEGHPELQGKLAVANAKLAYQNWKEVFSGERWDALEAKGASKQWCLWASTSTKNPAYRDVLYVEDLIGPQTVNTMPEETIQAFQDHGEVALTLERDLDEAHRVFEQVEAAGVSYDDVTHTLELEGVQKFTDSFEELLEGIRSKRGELVSA
jgi:transaldolase